LLSQYGDRERALEALEPGCHQRTPRSGREKKRETVTKGKSKEEGEKKKKTSLNHTPLTDRHELYER